MNFQDFVNYCCAHNILKHKWHLAYVWWYRNVILMALTKEIHCIYHVTKGFPGGLLTLDWPSYTSPSDVTPHAPILGISSIPYTWKGCLYIEPGALGLTWCWLTQLTMDTVYFSWFKTHRWSNCSQVKAPTYLTCIKLDQQRYKKKNLNIWLHGINNKNVHSWAQITIKKDQQHENSWHNF